MTIYSKTNPYIATLKERYSLCKPGSQKHTFHAVLDLQGSGITYNVGDSVAVFAEHDPELVKRTLHAMHCVGGELITEKHTGKSLQLKDFLRTKGNITEVSKKLIRELATRQFDPWKKERLNYILAESNKDAWKEYQAHHELYEVLEENPEVQFEYQELCHFLMPLLPRFYSIASSMKEVGEEVHLTISDLKYLSNGRMRYGVCTHYLCDLAPMHKQVIPIYVQPHHGFTIPPSLDASLIMIGPGTGVAPFRAFMQDRMADKAAGKNWLFFGECNQAFDYFYQDYWESLESKGILKVTTAFSRDQEHKIYVQHRMMEHAEEFFQWLQDGAYVFVCGDMHRMAKDVDAALHKIIQEQGKTDENGAKAYVKKLKTEKRYLRDVY